MKLPIRSWSLIFVGMQAITGLLTLFFAIWAFFFSPLSLRLEESYRTELALAKQELIDIRRAKSAVEEERASIVASSKELVQARQILLHEVTALSGQVSALREDRLAYANATRSVANARYLAMISYEFSLLRAVAEISANYDKHWKWLNATREFAKLEVVWRGLPSEQRHSSASQLTKEYYELQEATFDRPKFWWSIPNEPMLDPSDKVIIFTALQARMLNAEPEEFHKLASGWLLDRIHERDGRRSEMFAELIERSKRYAFLNALLPGERQQFNTELDGFFAKHPEQKTAELGVSVPRTAPVSEIVAAGKKQTKLVADTESKFRAYLSSIGIPPTTKGTAN